MKENSTDSTDKRNISFCPLLSIGNKTLQPCRMQDCAWWLSYRFDDLYTSYQGQGCSLQILSRYIVTRK